MKLSQSLMIVTSITLCAGCTARNTQPDYYGGNTNPQFTPIPQTLPGPASSDAILEAPGSDNPGGPTLLTPVPDQNPEARRRMRPHSQNVRTDPWGRPRNRRPRVQTTVRRQVRHRTLWQSQYQSGRRRPIQTVKIGIGHTRVLVLSSLRGADPASVTVVESLAEAMSNRAGLQNACTALFVRNPNPDGLALQSPENGRGIDLSRNFPSRNWQRTADAKAGPTAGSEIETRVIIRLIDDFKPDRIIVVQSAESGSRVHYAGPARQLARKVALPNGYRVSARAVGRSGSLEQFAGGDRRLPVVVLSLDRRLDGKTAWEMHADCLKTALTYIRPSPENHPRRPPAQQPEQTGPVAKTKTFPLPLNMINGPGEELSPPSDRLKAPHPSRRNYYELPPPGRR